jgi:biopolymer transport protein ExbB/TolQ
MKSRVLYNGPNLFMRVLGWVFLACLVFTIVVPLIAGLPPTWLTVVNGLLAWPIAAEQIRFYRMRAFFGEDIRSITMTKSDSEATTHVDYKNEDHPSWGTLS